ncbi:hypothetical protein HPB50_022581 [Hyalomma asiaticum]|uniref:Uncharacterized protein n=1 Tax=Hyalomma asiaticum TaxID=266040 RepID=A0ACB7RXB0_HYAAI|nr:hypothetical protein HPB50_022581 [Hyalomma asiaticum]
MPSPHRSVGGGEGPAANSSPRLLETCAHTRSFPSSSDSRSWPCKAMIVAFLRLVRDLLYSSVANLWAFFKLAFLERRGLTASHGEDASEVNAVLHRVTPFIKAFTNRPPPNFRLSMLGKSQRQRFWTTPRVTCDSCLCTSPRHISASVAIYSPWMSLRTLNSYTCWYMSAALMSTLTASSLLT